MEIHEFADVVEQILNDPDTDPNVANKLLLAISLDTRERSIAYQNSCNISITRLTELIETQTTSINQLHHAIEEQREYNKLHPPLLWLLRFRTIQTATVILFILMVLSLWYVSGLRQPILKWLGWPVF